MRLYHWLLLAFSAAAGLALGLLIQYGMPGERAEEGDPASLDAAVDESVAEVGDSPPVAAGTSEEARAEAATAGEVLTDGDIVGASRPDFEMPGLDGEPIDVARFDGDILVINFWATWCPPCVDEIPMLIELQEDFAEAGLQVFGVAVENPEPVGEFAAEFGIDYPLVADRRKGFEVAEAYGNPQGLMPYTVFVDREGTIRGVHQGLLTREQADAHLEAIPDGP